MLNLRNVGYMDDRYDVGNITYKLQRRMHQVYFLYRKDGDTDLCCWGCCDLLKREFVPMELKAFVPVFVPKAPNCNVGCVWRGFVVFVVVLPNRLEIGRASCRERV